MINLIQPSNCAIRAIAEDMRDADVEEVAAASGMSPLEALVDGWAVSDFAVVVTADAIPVAMYGLSIKSHLTGTGVPWLLATNQALRHKREFLVQSKPVVEEMLSICPTLYNYVHDKNTVSIRWLKWIGFTIDDPEPYGVRGDLFHRFHLERENV